MDLHDPITNFDTTRLNDQILMKSFYDNGYTGHQLYIINICRLRCKALTLSDITTASGTHIRKSAWNCEEDWIQAFERDWPRSPPSIPKDWIHLWQHALLRTFGQRTHNGTMELLVSLGAWTGAIPTSWNLRYKDNTLYLKDIHEWRIYEPTRYTRRNNKYKQLGTISHLPNDAEYATGELHDSFIYFTG